MKLKIILSVLIIAICSAAGYYLVYFEPNHLNPNSAQTYYKIFDKGEILNGTEDSATMVDKKLDQRLKKYHRVFVQMAGTTDEKKLRALFYMNFVHMSGVYGERTLSKKTISELLWDGDNQHCLTNSILLAMLLDKAGYQWRGIGIRGRGDHGYLEVNFDGQWQLLDPTVNLWINKSTAELLTGVDREERRFFLKAEDQFNGAAYRDNVIDLYDLMMNIGKGYKPTLSDYNCCFNLGDYKY